MLKGTVVASMKIQIVLLNILKRNGKKLFVKYRKYNKHHIEISSWVLDMNDEIIKNTIIHEIIHCFPECNNHLKKFKYYAEYINLKLGYNIGRLGDKKQDYIASGMYFENEDIYKYKIVCNSCNMVTFRKRFNKNKIKKYRCSKCRGKLSIIEL